MVFWKKPFRNNNIKENTLITFVIVQNVATLLVLPKVARNIIGVYTLNSFYTMVLIILALMEIMKGTKYRGIWWRYMQSLPKAICHICIYVMCVLALRNMCRSIGILRPEENNEIYALWGLQEENKSPKPSTNVAYR